MDDANRRRQEDWERSLNSWKAKQGHQQHKPQTHVVHPQINERKDNPILTKFLIFLAFAIPVAILGYALYINYLPFGYEETFTLTVDNEGIISPLSNEIYLTTPKGKKLLSLPDGVQGQVNLVFDPNVVLKNAEIDVSIEGDGVYLATPVNISDIDWDYDWDFSQSVPEDFEGTAQYREEEQCTHFNAYNEETLSLPNSEDMFESGPMSIYVKWKPSQISKELGNNQQILGHYNWELWQNTESVRFQVGRMINSSGQTYSISHPITEDFFNKEHEALAVYSPDEEGNGYIELFVDNNFVANMPINSDTIYEDYNLDKDLNIGWSPHNFGENQYFDGCIYNARISSTVLKQESKSISLYNVNQMTPIELIGNGNITSIILTVSQ